MATNNKTEKISVIILTYNEELNISQAINSIKGWADEVIVLDSFSEDKTVEIAQNLGAKIYKNKFINYSIQRNHALNLPSIGDWILFLDADEYLEEDLKNEISSAIKNPDIDAYYMKFRLIWNDVWIKRGYYPTWILRLGRKNQLKCDERPVNEHLECISNKTGRLKYDIMNKSQKPLTDWMIKHVRYAQGEANQLFIEHKEKYNFFGNQLNRKRWIKVNVWNNLPVVVRPFMYFIYRYILRLGFLDGKKAFHYHFLQAFIFFSQIDMLYLDKKWRNKKK